MRFLEMYSKSVMCGLALAAFVPLVSAHADSFTVLYAFKGGSDGAIPFAALRADKAGNLYGATFYGGSGGGLGDGTVYKLAPDGTETVLYSFCAKKKCVDGQNPSAGLIADDAGNLYGPTYYGGGSHHCLGGCGTVFKLAPDGTETVLHAFKTPDTGGHPQAALAANSKGKLYGTTEDGGSAGGGTAFEVERDGHYKVLHIFAGGTDGQLPAAGLLAYKGNYYGTTFYGGGGTCSAAGCGTVYKLTPDGTESVLYAFTGESDGGYADAALIADSAGNLYGTAGQGGNLSDCSGQGCGVVFKIAPDGTETVLYSFTGGADGAGPGAGLVTDEKGNLYGVTGSGGDLSCGTAGGCGTVFKLSADGMETVLHAFTGGSDGTGAEGLILRKGYLYGTTAYGGANSDGIVFKLRT